MRGPQLPGAFPSSRIEELPSPWAHGSAASAHTVASSLELAQGKGKSIGQRPGSACKMALGRGSLAKAVLATDPLRGLGKVGANRRAMPLERAGLCFLPLNP